MISTAPQAGCLGAAPVLLEHRVEMIAAIGRLDVSEVGALAAQLLPIDVTLPTGNIDAVHSMVFRRRLAEIDRLGIAEAAAVDFQALRERPHRHSVGSDRFGRRKHGELPRLLHWHKCARCDRLDLRRLLGRRRLDGGDIFGLDALLDARGFRRLGISIELVISAEGRIASASRPLDVQPAARRHAKREMTTPGARILTCTQYKTDRRRNAAGKNGAIYEREITNKV
jgi:hypothetical protein